MKINTIFAFILGLLSPLFLKSQQLQNIPKAISEIGDQIQTLPFSTKGFDIPRSQGHYQGIQFHPQGSYAYISGSSANRAYQLIIDIKKKASVRQVHIFDQDPYRHAGGIQIYKQYLIVGVEDNAKRTISKIQIYDLNPTPFQPKKLIEIPRNGDYEVSTAGAVAMTKSDNFYYLIVGSWDCQTLDIYKSNGKALEDSDCAFSKEATWVRNTSDRSEWSDPEFSSYQNLNLLSDNKGNLFLLGFAQTGKKEVVDVFEVSTLSPLLNNRRIRKVMRKEIPLKKTTFKAGGGSFINNQGKINIFACHHRKSIIEIVGDFELGK